ncbi:invasion associated locus B family protein [Ruegeria sp. HKCCD8929]|uniref:invasion associated locus B family protein n=1 Tax=Ruegeria sp. HKCCD8929 TaxID=2683006 RepID=UPI001488494D
MSRSSSEPVKHLVVHVGKVSLLPAVVALALTTSAGSAQEPNALSETYGVWAVQCKTANAPEGDETIRTCQVSQELRQADTQQRVISAVFTANPDKLTLITPFGLQLGEGVRFSTGNGELPVGWFSTCLQTVGCVADIAPDADGMENLQSSQTLTVLMTSINGQTLRADLSLNGFKDAVKRLRVLQ